MTLDVPKRRPYEKQDQEQRYLWYVRDLGLGNLIEANQAMDVCVVGSGNAYFGEELRTRYPKMHVLNVDPAEHAYEQVSGTQSINHDSLSIAMPDNSFDLLVSYQAFPKYFYWRMDDQEKKDTLARSGVNRWYSYEYAAPDTSIEDVVGNIKESLIEMLRIVRPGGVIKFLPVKEAELLNFKEFIQSINPGHTVKIFSRGLWKKQHGIEIVKAC
jgi:Methyltransferase domain